MDARQKIEELTALVERVKQEAQIHAQEARTANHTIAEIYQLCTGGTGEPGNWNGAEPVRQTLASQAAEIERLRAELSNIAFARRFDREYFANDTAFADWAISRAGHALTQPTE